MTKDELRKSLYFVCQDGTYYYEDLLELYRNYLYSLEYRKEYGNKYGDTEELIKGYEKKLGVRK